MRKLLHVFLVCSGVIFGACQAVDSAGPRAPAVRMGSLTGCEETRPDPDSESSVGDPPPSQGCQVEGTPLESELSYLGAVHNDGGSYYPEFYGQTFTFDDVANSSGAYSSCPDVLQNVWFLMVINGQIEKFQTVGYAHKIGEVPMLSDNFARASYQLPFDNVYSRSGRYFITDGKVKAACIHGRFQFIVGGIFGGIDASDYRIYGYEGIINVSSNPQSGGTAGWSFQNSSSGYSNGNGDGWGDALYTYLETGNCTPHWDVYVDGVAVCKDGIRQS